jgi:hypothetical protein
MHRALIRLLTTSLVLALGVGAGVVLTPSPSLASPAAAPVLTVPGPQTVNEGAALAFVVSATDADGQPLVFRAAGMPAGATFHDNHDNTASFSWTPSFTQAGIYGPTFIVDDTFGGVDSKGVPITVNNVNQAPVLDPIGDRSVERGTNMSIFLSGADPDGDAVSFSTANLPSWASFTDFGDGTAQLGLAPPLSMMPTSVSMTVSLSDGNLTSSETFSITVYSVDSTNPPVLATIGDQTVAEGATKDVGVSATDQDGQTLSWTISLPGIATFTPTGSAPGSASGTMSLAPGYCDSGTYAASIGVSDGGMTDNENFVITVSDVNRAPAWNPPQGGYTMTMNEGGSGDVSVQASDPDQACGTGAPTLWYLSNGVPASLTVTFTDQGGGQGLLHVAAGFDAAGSHTLTLRAKDATNPSLTTDASVHVTVVSVDRAPVASAGGPYSDLVGSAMAMSAAGSSDPDGDALTYAWSFGDGGSGSGVEVTHAYSAAGHYAVMVNVSDGTLSAADTTSADVRSAFLARAFTDHSTIRLNTGKPTNSVFLEAVGGSFPISSVDVSSLKLYAPEGLGTVPFITPVPGSVTVGQDFDRNGAAEVAMDFAKDDLRSLFANLNNDMLATMVVTADLLGGGSVHATLGWTVMPEKKLVVRAQPNPMNPETTIRVHLETAERLSIRLFDLRGRLVRTMFEGVDTPAGVHDYKFDGKSSSGLTLPSGQYFYRAETPTAKSSGALIILK